MKAPRKRTRRSKLPAPPTKRPPLRAPAPRDPAAFAAQVQASTDGLRHTVAGQMVGSVESLPHVVNLVAIVAVVVVAVVALALR
jgi:hypothetical protein